MKHRIFVASSVEGKALADAIQVNLDYDAYCTVWPQIFTVGTGDLDSLIEGVRTNDFGVFVLSPDDLLRTRDEQYRVPRDNVILEAGMFLGRYGKGKTFLVTPRGVKDFHLPSDLLGITLADYDAERLKRDLPEATLGSVCTRIKTAIKKVPNYLNDISFEASHLIGPNTWSFPSKLSIDIINNSNCDVVLKSAFFTFGMGLRRSSKAKPIGSPIANKVKYEFRGPKGIHTLSTVLLMKGERTNTYAGIDPSMASADVQKAIANKKSGELHVMCYWMDENPRVQYHVVNL